MTLAARHPCAQPGCRELLERGERWCSTHRRNLEAEDRRRRGSARERGYDHRWAKLRLAFLNEHPLCAECGRNGRITTATVVDHVIPHKGDQSLFDDPNNLQPLCKPCHDRKTATEDGGFGG